MYVKVRRQCLAELKYMPISVTERSKARVCGQTLAGVAGSNPAVGMDVGIVCFKYSQKIQNARQSREIKRYR